MTWTKLSDDYPDDTWTLSDAAYRLHTDGLVWSNRKLLDLFIAAEDLPRCSKRPEAVAELVAAGFWREHGDGCLIVHHGLYQRTREQVVKRQEANRRNGAKGGRPVKPTESDVDVSETQSVSESVSESPPHRDRTGQDRTSPRKSVTDAHTRERSLPIPCDWPGGCDREADPRALDTGRARCVVHEGGLRAMR